jgi:hypothetical protein
LFSLEINVEIHVIERARIAQRLNQINVEIHVIERARIAQRLNQPVQYLNKRSHVYWIEPQVSPWSS